MNSLFAQDCIKNSKWSIGFAVSPDYSHRFIKNSKKTINSFLTGYYYYSDQLARSGFHLALSVGYNFCENFEVKSGFNFFCADYKTKTFYVIQYNQAHQRVGTNSYRLKRAFYYLGLPISFGYKIRCAKKLLVELGIGLSINYYTTSEVTPRDWYGWYTEIEGFNSILMAQVGIKYNINRNLSLDVLPNFNYFTTPLHDPNTLDGANKELNLYSAGIEIGLNYNFGRKIKK